MSALAGGVVDEPAVIGPIRGADPRLEPVESAPERDRVAGVGVVPREVGGGRRQVVEDGLATRHGRRDPGHARAAERIQHDVSRLRKMFDEGADSFGRHLGVVAVGRIQGGVARPRHEAVGRGCIRRRTAIGYRQVGVAQIGRHHVRHDVGRGRS